MNVIKFNKPTAITIRPLVVRTVTRPALTVILTEIDFSINGWDDEEGQQKLYSNIPKSKQFPRGLKTLVMGEGSPTPYDSGWSQSDAEKALLLALGITAVNGVVTAVNGTSV